MQNDDLDPTAVDAGSCEAALEKLASVLPEPFSEELKTALKTYPPQDEPVHRALRGISTNAPSSDDQYDIVLACMYAGNMLDAAKERDAKLFADMLDSLNNCTHTLER